MLENLNISSVTSNLCSHGKQIRCESVAIEDRAYVKAKEEIKVKALLSKWVVKSLSEYN